MNRKLDARALLIVALAACDAAAVDASYWDRNEAERPAADQSTPGRTDEPAQVADGGSTDAAPASACFSLQLTTTSYGGEYGPDHVGAIWISKPDGTFVQTLEAWGTKRLRNAIAWRAASGGNVVDAITGATRQQHGAHSVTWACSAAPGPYVAHVEYTEDDSAKGAPAGPHRQIAFDTSVPGALTEADDATYGAIVAVVPDP